MSIKIVIYDPIGLGPEVVSAIEHTAPTANVVAPSAEGLSAELADAEVFFGWHPEPTIFGEAKVLRWIQSTSAGMEKLLNPDLIARGLKICNASGVHAPQVTETAWALTLTIARGLPTYLRQQQEHHWGVGPLYDLDGGTAGIVGLGGIGRRYASIASAFGMRVVAVDAHEPPKPNQVESLWKMDCLDKLLAMSDVVLISCPFSKETLGLIDRGRLDCMKSTAILINIARGGIVDEDALSAVLRVGGIAGAGLDVVATEPLPPESPLWEVPNLVITPHCAGLSSRRIARLTNFFCDNLRRYLADEPLANVVAQDKGYPIPGSS